LIVISAFQSFRTLSFFIRNKVNFNNKKSTNLEKREWTLHFHYISISINKFYTTTASLDLKPFFTLQSHFAVEIHFKLPSCHDIDNSLQSMRETRPVDTHFFLTDVIGSEKE